jgi:gas vesicle protein
MRHRKTENTMALLGGAVLGAAAMYLLDPEAGRRRRQYIAETAGDTLRSTGETIAPALESLSDRAREIAGRLADRAGDARDSARGAGSEAYEGARGMLGGAYESSRDALSGWGESLGDWGRSFGRRMSRRSERAASDWSDRARRLNPWREEESHAGAYTAAGISAAALGAGLIYLFDPTNGRRRRSAAGDAVGKIVKQTGSAFRDAGQRVQDLMNRGRGTAIEAGRRVTGGRGERVSAEQLLQRVRSQMGHVVSHAGAIQVMTDADGVVTLSGRVLASEVDALISTVNKTGGVSQVINRLDVQDTVEGVTGQPAATPRL